jgi:general stress protein 26
MGQKAERKERELMSLARDFEVVMLCTVAADGSVHARPMMVADIDEQNCWWFITSKTTGKVDEIANDAHATVTLQSKTAFASLSGRATVVRDQSRTAELWQKQFRAWFPQGPDDPTAVLLRFVPTTGEYWERDRMDAVKLTLEKARALVVGDRVKPERAGDHGKVAMH